MDSSQRWDVQSGGSHRHENQLFVTIWDGGNLFFFFLTYPNPSSEQPLKMYLIKLCPKAEQISPPTLFSGPLNAILPLYSTSIWGFLKRFPSLFYVLLQNPGTWEESSCLWGSAEHGFTKAWETQPRNPGQVTVLPLLCTKAKGSEAPRSREGFPPTRLPSDWAREKARGKAQSHWGWRKAGARALGSAARWLLLILTHVAHAGTDTWIATPRTFPPPWISGPYWEKEV